MHKIKLCRIIYEFVPRIGGSITHVIELAEKMQPYCERQFFIVPKIKDNTTKLDASFPFEVYRVKYCELKILQTIKSRFLNWLPVAPLIRLSFGLAAIKKCLWLNKKYGLDIIQSHGVGAGPAATIAGKLMRKPSIWMMHGTEEAYSKIAGFYETMVTWIFRPDHLLVLDDGSRAPDKFHKIMTKNKVTTVYYAIDTQVFCPKERNEELVGYIGVENSFVVMAIQSLIPVKGLHYAILAFAEFLKLSNAENAKLVIIGDGSDKDKLENLVISLGLQDKVKFLGQVPNTKIPDYLALADIVLAASVYSNMNRSLHETMACGKPVLCFDSGNIRHTIVDRENGLLAKSGNTSDLANKLLDLFVSPDLRGKLGSNARKFCEGKRRWNNRINAELEVYRQLLGKRGEIL
jgi:glycosyltransferase involved in cell wall biosynthesis